MNACFSDLLGMEKAIFNESEKELLTGLEWSLRIPNEELNNYL